MNKASEGIVTSVTVEYNLTDHCNLKCYACDHASPLLPPRFARLEDFVSDFEALAGAFHSEELRLVGGEPLLHPDLALFLEEGRRIGVADSIVVYTNGVLLHEMPEAFWTLIDQLHVSAYPGVRRRLDDEACAKMCRKHGVKLQIDHVERFYKCLLSRPIADERLVGAIFQACEAANVCLTVQDGRFYKCSAAAIIKPWLALHEVDFENRASDGVALHANPNLRGDLKHYLDSRAPLAACTYCLGTSGSPRAHRQVDRAGCAKWLKEDDAEEIQAVRQRLG